MAITDSNLLVFLGDRIAITNQAISDWHTRFVIDPYRSLIKSESIYRFVAELTVLKRVQAIVIQAKDRPRLQMIREMALSAMMTSLAQDERAMTSAVRTMEQYELIAWSGLLNDLNAGVL